MYVWDFGQSEHMPWPEDSLGREGGREGCPGPPLWLSSWWESHGHMREDAEEDPAHVHGSRTFSSCAGTRGSKGLWLGQVVQAGGGLSYGFGKDPRSP